MAKSHLPPRNLSVRQFPLLFLFFFFFLLAPREMEGDLLLPSSLPIGQTL